MYMWKCKGLGEIGMKRLHEKIKTHELKGVRLGVTERFRELYSDLLYFIEDNCKQSRETSLAITKLEESLMWLTKGISREDDDINETIE